MEKGDPGSQHQGGVTLNLGPHSITFRSANQRPTRFRNGEAGVHRAVLLRLIGPVLG
jgi:hypothetical protein